MAGLRDIANSWWGSTIPPTFVSSTTATWVGLRAFFDVPCRIAGIRAYVVAGEDGNTRAMIWNHDTAELLRSTGFRVRASSAGDAWHQTWFRPWFRPVAGQAYRLAVLYPHGKYFRQVSALGGGVTHNGIRAVSSFQTTSIVPEIITITDNSNANGVDFLIYPD